MATLTIRLTLGNEAMRTEADIAALLATAFSPECHEDVTVGMFGSLRDMNGNNVGHWRVE